MKITQSAIARLTLPEGKREAIHFDEDVPGFGLRLRSAGGRNWIFQYRVGRRQRRMTFGSVGAMTAAQAREQAEQLHARVKLGQDPAGAKIEDKARAAETFGAVMKAYLNQQKVRLRPRSYTEFERSLLVHCKPLHDLGLTAINPRTIATRLIEIETANGPAAANSVRAVVSSLYAWAVRAGLAETNPVTGTGRAMERGPRTRVLGDGELAAIWRALPGNDYGRVVKVLLLTGQRRDEIGRLRWSEVSLGEAVIVLPPERTKNGHENIIPLSAPVLDILRSQPRVHDCVFGRTSAGFTGYSKSKKELDQRIAAARGAPIAPWVLHDLRRTFSTRLHGDLGVAPHIVEALINHTSGHRSGVAGVYNRALYTVPKTQAMAAWAERLMAIVESREPAGNVVPISAVGLAGSV
jgi:integrase